jgi:hypothetical protein
MLHQQKNFGVAWMGFHQVAEVRELGSRPLSESQGLAPIFTPNRKTKPPNFRWRACLPRCSAGET